MLAPAAAGSSIGCLSAIVFHTLDEYLSYRKGQKEADTEAKVRAKLQNQLLRKFKFGSLTGGLVLNLQPTEESDVDWCRRVKQMVHADLSNGLADGSLGRCLRAASPEKVLYPGANTITRPTEESDVEWLRVKQKVQADLSNGVENGRESLRATRYPPGKDLKPEESAQANNDRLLIVMQKAQSDLSKGLKDGSLVMCLGAAMSKKDVKPEVSFQSTDKAKVRAKMQSERYARAKGGKITNQVRPESRDDLQSQGSPDRQVRTGSQGSPVSQRSSPWSPRSMPNAKVVVPKRVIGAFKMSGYVADSPSKGAAGAGDENGGKAMPTADTGEANGLPSKLVGKEGGNLQDILAPRLAMYEGGEKQTLSPNFTKATTHATPVTRLGSAPGWFSPDSRWQTPDSRLQTPVSQTVSSVQSPASTQTVASSPQSAEGPVWRTSLKKVTNQADPPPMPRIFTTPASPHLYQQKTNLPRPGTVSLGNHRARPS